MIISLVPRPYIATLKNMGWPGYEANNYPHSSQLIICLINIIITLVTRHTLSEREGGRGRERERERERENWTNTYTGQLVQTKLVVNY